MVPDVNSLTADALRGLARKYERLASWRDRRDGGGPAVPRDELRALAAESPGCLRELDTLGTAELARRAAACGKAADDPAAAEPWMGWVDGYHALVRRALAAREARGRGQPPGGDFEAAVLAPPGGRMSVVVMRALADRFGVPAATIASALFPVRRPSPYAL